MTTETKIYTSGIWNKSKDMGGYGIVITLEEGEEAKLCAGFDENGLGVSELKALIEGLEYALDKLDNPYSQIVTVFVDTRFMYDAATKWIKGWAKRGWVTKENTPVKNKELWQRVHFLKGQFGLVKWEFIDKGDENPSMKLAEALAKHAIQNKATTWPEFKDVEHLIMPTTAELIRDVAMTPKKRIVEKYEMGGAW